MSSWEMVRLVREVLVPFGALKREDLLLWCNLLPADLRVSGTMRSVTVR